MEAGTVGMPNGVHLTHVNGAAMSGAFTSADVVMSELPTAEAAAEAAKAAATPNNGQMPGRKTVCLREEMEDGTQGFLALMDSMADNFHQLSFHAMQMRQLLQTLWGISRQIPQ